MVNFSFLLRQVSESYPRSGSPEKILIGLSGGADSVALTRVLTVFCRECGAKLFAVHVNHGLRPEAKNEEAFCEALCETLGIPLAFKRVEVAKNGSLEAEARKARYRAFEEALKETGANALALAHHLDDQAETVLLHLLYGTGMDGLGGMKEYRAPVWRPFLGIRRSALQAALTELGQSWCEDQSNESIIFTRNYLRLNVLPPIAARFPEAVSAIGRTATIVQDENEFLSSLAEEWIRQNAAHGKWPFLMIGPLLNQHPAMQRRIFRSYLKSRHVELLYDQTERLRTLLQSPAGAMCNLPLGWQALRTKERLHFLSPHRSGKETALTALTEARFTGDVGDGALRQSIPIDLLSQSNLRTRAPGDWITPFGMQGKIKLKDYMISRGIDRPFRNDWPLLCIGNEVLWVVGVGASERLRYDEKDHYDNYRLVTYSGVLPDAI